MQPHAEAAAAAAARSSIAQQQKRRYVYSGAFVGLRITKQRENHDDEVTANFKTK